MAEPNVALKSAFRAYDKVRDDYLDALRAKGLVFGEPGAGAAERERLRDELRKRGAEFRNGGASIRAGWISPACIECTGNKGSETFSTTFKCHRDCYFCFNANLADYQKFFREGCPWEEGLERASCTYTSGLAAIGLTGGEPLLDIDDTIEFLQRAGKLFPQAHKRMYTSGDLLTPEIAERLRDAGLEEIRFSVKDDDTDSLQRKVLDNMELAKRYIPHVMVEMPIIPGADEHMRALFREFDRIGIDGINLLEFCFPFHNWEEFSRRGFVLKNPPFDVMYDYGYSGGLAVAGSEDLCLELMAWALDEGMSFGMHYCSLDNKHRSEMRQLNERGAHVHPCFEFDEDTFFLKTAKVFGPDRPLARKILSQAGCDAVLENEEEDSTTFPPRYAGVIAGVGCSPAYAFDVLDSDEEGSFLREVALSSVE